MERGYGGFCFAPVFVFRGLYRFEGIRESFLRAFLVRFASVCRFGDSQSGFPIGFRYHRIPVPVRLVHGSSHEILSQWDLRSFRTSVRHRERHEGILSMLENRPEIGHVRSVFRVSAVRQDDREGRGFRGGIVRSRSVSVVEVFSHFEEVRSYGVRVFARNAR